METINWSEFEERAARMTNEQLQNACKAIIDALPAADALDRATGQDRGGQYRDESSVYRRELDKRAKVARIEARVPRCTAAERFGKAVANLMLVAGKDEVYLLAGLQELYRAHMLGDATSVVSP